MASSNLTSNLAPRHHALTALAYHSSLTAFERSNKKRSSPMWNQEWHVWYMNGHMDYILQPRKKPASDLRMPFLARGARYTGTRMPNQPPSRQLDRAFCHIPAPMTLRCGQSQLSVTECHQVPLLVAPPPSTPKNTQNRGRYHGRRVVTIEYQYEFSYCTTMHARKTNYPIISNTTSARVDRVKNKLSQETVNPQLETNLLHSISRVGRHGYAP